MVFKLSASFILLSLAVLATTSPVTEDRATSLAKRQADCDQTCGIEFDACVNNGGAVNFLLEEFRHHSDSRPTELLWRRTGVRYGLRALRSLPRRSHSWWTVLIKTRITGNRSICTCHNNVKQNRQKLKPKSRMIGPWSRHGRTASHGANS
ncbi:hypothetical protein B0H19DRAFT_1082797 [Mycena capillaripes]|nr:hypothetical protein B0H19DRAFT_1082797 [Mycena capillaripes]